MRPLKPTVSAFEVEMQWIINNKKKLLWLEVTGLLAVAGTILTLQSKGIMEVQPLVLGLMVLPWLLSIAAGLPLIYLVWFSRPWASILFEKSMKIFFWLITCVSFIIFFVIYGRFVFNII